ncbi:hypothetical protein K458DRAFT_396485 [Lentithecium fluviatile CBS 122367]|uniref:Uncharacterized protein n=1 Tax=Lentithecium fluviatile CBS 122367 TaxID=1168545 RepID=A0A6G1IFJ4_9PLEO|nr:hypothetical protein K458DRAFT_396485 [Lentithecium fluviatile CBS 122367]
MGLYQRRRPSPIKVYPNPVRRQEPSATEEPESASSVGTTPGPESPDSPSPTTTGPAASTSAPAQASSSAPAAAVTSRSSASPPSPTTTPPQAAQQTSTSAGSSSTQAASSSSTATSSGSSTNGPSITARPAPGAAAQIGDDGSASETSEPDSPASPTSSSQPTGSATVSTTSVTSSASSETASASPPRSQLAGESSGIDRDPPHSPGHRTLGKGAEAGLITSAVLGFVALLVGIYFLYKRRRRRRQELGMRHAENGFAPDNTGSLAEPETVHIGFDPDNSHITRTTNDSNSLFGGSHYQRPETVSTNTNSRAPLPTPNPFADPPRNKAYDQLRGRPRSTTLTDRGSWIKNPFKDPESDRFDPFGEMQERARQERIKYMQELRQEEMDRRQREREQQFLEKERMGLGVPEAALARKGSGVTVEGVGILDRSGSERYR